VFSLSNDAEALISEGLNAEARHESLAALDFFRRADAIHPGDPVVLQKIAQQLSDAAFLESDPVETECLTREALKHAERAAQLDPHSAVNRLSLAVLYGRLAGYEDVGKKVEYARLIKREAEVALELDPNYAWAYHVLGRWHREMSEIGGTRRLKHSAPPK
jgi:tetratricopeptide (TPR) repeat protein